MLTLAKLVNAILAIIVFGLLRVATADMGTAAWAVSLAGAIVVFYILRAIFVSPLLKRATHKASRAIIDHFAGGGDMGGAIRIAKGLGLGTKEAQEVADAHKDALVKALTDRILKDAKHRYEQRKDKEEVKRYLRDEGIPENAIQQAVEQVVRESK